MGGKGSGRYEPLDSPQKTRRINLTAETVMMLNEIQRYWGYKNQSETVRHLIYEGFHEIEDEIGGQ